jgi:hypothetical protein
MIRRKTRTLSDADTASESKRTPHRSGRTDQEETKTWRASQPREPVDVNDVVLRLARRASSHGFVTRRMISVSTWRVHDPEASAAGIYSSGLRTSAIGRLLMRRSCAPPPASETKGTGMRANAPSWIRDR